jgi:hypothetical protein
VGRLISGALAEPDFVHKLERAGFRGVEILRTVEHRRLRALPLFPTR